MNLIELLEACRVSLTCGPLLGTTREWVAWTEVKKLDGSSCWIVAPQSLVPRLRRDAGFLDVNAGWQEYQLPKEQNSLSAIGKVLVGKVARRADRFLWRLGWRTGCTRRSSRSALIEFESCSSTTTLTAL